jgi:hypothetical protein
MSSNFIAVALFAAFVVGGILGEIVPLWAVVLVGLAIAVAAFVVMDRYPDVRKAGRTQPAPGPVADEASIAGRASDRGAQRRRPPAGEVSE